MAISEMTIRLALALVAVLLGLGCGLGLRLWLVRRLKKTVLDVWLVQLLGALVMLPALLISAVVAVGTLTNGLNELLSFWFRLSDTAGLKSQDVTLFGRNCMLSVLIG